MGCRHHLALVNVWERGCPCLDGILRDITNTPAGQRLVGHAIDLLQARSKGDFPELLPAAQKRLRPRPPQLTLGVFSLLDRTVGFTIPTLKRFIRRAP